MEVNEYGFPMFPNNESPNQCGHWRLSTELIYGQLEIYNDWRLEMARRGWFVYLDKSSVIRGGYDVYLYPFDEYVKKHGL